MTCAVWARPRPRTRLTSIIWSSLSPSARNITGARAASTSRSEYPTSSGSTIGRPWARRTACRSSSSIPAFSASWRPVRVGGPSMTRRSAGRNGSRPSASLLRISSSSKPRPASQSSSSSRSARAGSSSPSSRPVADQSISSFIATKVRHGVRWAERVTGEASDPTRRMPTVVMVLGIDPGLANTGYGVVQRRSGRLAALDGGVVETPSDWAVERRLVRDAPADQRPDPRAPAGRRRARGALLRAERPQRLRRRPGPWRRGPRRRAARAAHPRLHAPAGQGRRLRHRPRREGPGRADGPGAPVADRAAAPRPRVRRAGGGDLPRQPRPADRGAARRQPRAVAR